MKNKFFIFYFLCSFFLFENYVLSQCQGTEILNGKIENYKGLLVYPIKQGNDGSVFPVTCNLKDGSWCILFQDTNLVFCKFNIISMKIEGELLFFHRNGKLASSIKLVGNKRNGKSIHYYDNGVPSLKSKWRNGKQHGIWKYYNFEGKIYQKKAYYEGKLISEFVNFGSVPEELKYVFKER